MNVSFYLPTTPILWGMIVYVVIGVVLFVPFVLWSNRFMASRPKGFSGIRNIPLAILKVILFWPVMLVVFTKTEIEYRKKGYL